LYGTEGGQYNPVAENIFLTSDNNRVELSSKGLLVINNMKDSVYFTKIDSAKPDERTMQEYVGEYYSEEVEAKYLVQIKNGKLILLLRPKSEFPLMATYKDGFESPAGTIYFEREKNKIIHFKISVARARNVEFRKIK